MTASLLFPQLGVLRCLVTSQTRDAQMQGQEDGERGRISAEAVSKAMSVGFIAQIINEDEYEVEGVLENWIEFLLHHKIDGETRYSLYHSSFRDWVGRQLNAS